MSFILKDFDFVNASYTNNVPNPATYTSVDTMATVVASAYFNDILDRLTVDDRIDIEASDARKVVVVTSVTTNVTVVDYTADILDGGDVANVADGNVVGGIMLVHRIDTAGGATADTPLVLTHKSRLMAVKVVNNAIGTTDDTITIKNGSTAITDAIDIFTADKVVAYDGTLDDAQVEIAAGATVNVTETDGGGSDSPPVTVYLTVMKVA